MRLLPKVLWYVLALFAFVNALEALRYLLPHVPFPAPLDNFNQRRIALSLHALGGDAAAIRGSIARWRIDGRRVLPGIRRVSSGGLVVPSQ